MKHYYQQTREAYELVSRFEVLSKKGGDIHFEETAFVQLVDFYEMEESFSKALEVIDLALSVYKFSSKLHTRKALLLIENKKEELALESLDRAEVFGQSFIEIDILRARAHAYLGNHDLALELLADLKLNYYTSPQEISNIYLEEALIFERLEEFERMFLVLKHAVRHDPFNQKALEKMWLSVELTKNHSESLDIHYAVIDENPYSYQTWFNLGHAHYFLREYEDALIAFEYAFITNERFEPAYKEFAEVCFHLKRYNQALDALEEALEFFPSDSDLLLKIGECYEYMGKFGKSKIFLYRALSLNHQDDEVYYHIAECYSKEKEFSSAIHFYKQAIKIDDHREDYLIGLANAYYHTGQYQKALPIYQQATEMGPELSTNWVQFAWFLVHIDGYEEAYETLIEAEENAYGADLFYCKAALLFKMGERKSAFHFLGEALMENFDQRELFFEFVPELRLDKDIKAIMRYYAAEV